MTWSVDTLGGGQATGPAPYPGLASFRDSDEDAELFFGRSAERDLIIANLMSARVTVLYGPSGVGKSSLLHAGVIHRLRTQPQPSRVIVVDDWDADATGVLIGGVRAAVGDPAAWPGPGPPLSDALESLSDRRSGALLVILDQFEEYLRLHPEPSNDGFEDALAALLTPTQVLARVLIGVRDDRLADLDRLEGRIPHLFGNVLRLEPLTRVAAMDAIVQPVERYNARLRGSGEKVTLEAGLAERILGELGELGDRSREAHATADGEHREAMIEPAFLSLTMRRLWDTDTASGRTTLRLATLSSLGGAAHIFATHLDLIMGSLSPAEQRLAADILRFLVTPSGAMQRYSARDLATYVNRPSTAVEALADKLVGEPARILRPAATPVNGERQAQYELAHQVLARPALDWRNRYQTARLERRSRRLLVALVAVSAIALALVGYVINPSPLRRLELGTVDARFTVRGSQPPDQDIVLVTVGDRAYTRLFTSLSHERATIAQGLDQIEKAHPRAVAVDVAFTKPIAGRSDLALGGALHRDRSRLVLASFTLETAGNTEVLGRGKYTDHSAPAVGYDGLPGNPSDPSAVYRTMEKSVELPLQGAKPMETLGVATARVAGLSRAAIARLPPEAWIDFRGGAGTFPAVPFFDVLAGRPAALARLRDRIVVLGYTARQANDIHDTSAPGTSVMTGPEVQADAISTALRRFPLRNAGLGVDIALIVILGLIPLVLGLRLNAVLCAAGVLAAAILFCVGAQVAFDSGRVVNVVFPLAALALSAAAVLAALLLRHHSRAGHARWRSSDDR